jgi:hypothetical protein
MGSIIQTEDINSVNSLISSEIGRGVRNFFNPYIQQVLVSRAIEMLRILQESEVNDFQGIAAEDEF